MFVTGNTVIDALKTTVTEGFTFAEDGLNTLDYTPRLHVAHGDLLVKRRQRPGKGGGGVPMDQHQV